MADDEKDKNKMLRFSAGTTSPTHDSGKKYQATAKYDRKLLKVRLAIEEWMHYQLQTLYSLEDGEEYEIEIDIDILLRKDNDVQRTEMLQKLLHGAKESSDKFIKELLVKIKELDAVTPTSKTTTTAEMII